MSQEGSGVPNGGECALEAPMVHWPVDASPHGATSSSFLGSGPGLAVPPGLPGFRPRA